MVSPLPGNCRGRRLPAFESGGFANFGGNDLDPVYRAGLAPDEEYSVRNGSRLRVFDINPA